MDRYGTRLTPPKRRVRVSKLTRPASASAAAAALAANRRAAPIAGGTDLIPAQRQGVANPAELVDLASLEEISALRETAAGDLEIGAGVRLADLLGAPQLRGDRAITESVAAIATPQIREMATVGGNLCQQKRCWFYRSGLMCYKRGGAACPCYAVLGDHRFYHAAMGAHRCQAVTPSDLATALLALDAVATIRGAGGERPLTIDELYTGPGETDVRRGELLAGVTVPASARRRVSAFEKLALWSGDFAVASACASLELRDDGTLGEVRVVLGAIALTPVRLPDVEQALTGRAVDSLADLRSVAGAWTHRAHPLPNNEWKLSAATGLVHRALERCLR